MDKQVLKEIIKEALLELGVVSMQPRWLSTKEAVFYSGLSRNTLYKLYQEGEIYATSIRGGKLLWDRESIDEYLLREKKEFQVKTRRLLNEIKNFK